MAKMKFRYEDVFPACNPGVDPVGHKTLLQLYTAPQRTASGFILPAESRDLDQGATCLAVVLALGPACFRNRETGEPWKTGPWYQVGDVLRIPRSKTGDQWDVPTDIPSGEADETLRAYFLLMNDELPYGIVRDLHQLNITNPGEAGPTAYEVGLLAKPVNQLTAPAAAE